MGAGWGLMLLENDVGEVESMRVDQGLIQGMFIME